MATALALLAAAFATGCTTLEAPAHPRPALPLPAELAQRFALPGGITEDYLVPINEPGPGGRRILRGRLQCGEERPEFHLMLPPVTPAPFIMCLPILAGGEGLMWYIADRLAAKGYAVAWGKRVHSALRIEQSVADVERLFRRTVLHHRVLLHWVREQPWALADRTALFGISTGGLIAGTLSGLEPEIGAVILILAGADLPGILERSSEARIVTWRRHRRRVDDQDALAFHATMRRELHSDPGRIAPYVATDKVMLVSGRFDTVVRQENQDLLWEGLGRPTRLLLPLSHYTAILAIHTILSQADRFIAARFRGRP